VIVVFFGIAQPARRHVTQNDVGPLTAQPGLGYGGRRLPPGGSAVPFGAATVSFGLRNVVDLDGALAELARVVAPGGKLVVLEFAVPRLRPLRALYLFYFRQLLPRIGRLISGDGGAYSYLPSSVLQFPQRQELLDRFAAAGFGEGDWDDLSGGIVCLYAARRVAA